MDDVLGGLPHKTNDATRLARCRERYWLMREP